MKFVSIAIASLMASTTWGFGPALPVSKVAPSGSSLHMVLEKPVATKKISKLESLKLKSENLVHPLKEVRNRKQILPGKERARETEIERFAFIDTPM